MKFFYLKIISIIALLLTTCDNDEPLMGEDIIAPETYSFSRNGATSVNFSKQTTIAAMTEEFINALKVSNNTETILAGMFDHAIDNDDFSSVTLNTSEVSIRKNVAASAEFFEFNEFEADLVKTTFDDWIIRQANEVFPNWETQASSGIAGFIEDTNNSTTVFITDKGESLDQLIANSLSGALYLDQILNNHLGFVVLDGGDNIRDNDEDVFVANTNYTAMENSWDQAYGYLYSAEAVPANPNFDDEIGDNFLSLLLAEVSRDPDFENFDEEVYEAFKLGRAAIVNKDYDLRDDQIAIIRDRLSQSVGIRAVYHLNAAKALLDVETTINYAAVFDNLGKALGLIYSLQFTRISDANTPFLSAESVDEYFSDLLDQGNGLWEDDITDKLNVIAEEIADEFDFTFEQASDSENAVIEE